MSSDKIRMDEALQENRVDERPSPPDSPMHEEETQRHYAIIFVELEPHYLQHHAQGLHRLMHDPFYHALNVSSASRLWMIRHLKCLSQHAEESYGVGLVEVFDSMGFEGTLEFFQLKNAPIELIERWLTLLPHWPGDAIFVPEGQHPA